MPFADRRRLAVPFHAREEQGGRGSPPRLKDCESPPQLVFNSRCCCGFDGESAFHGFTEFVADRSAQRCFISGAGWAEGRFEESNEVE